MSKHKDTVEEVMKRQRAYINLSGSDSDAKILSREVDSLRSENEALKEALLAEKKYSGEVTKERDEARKELSNTLRLQRLTMLERDEARAEVLKLTGALQAMADNDEKWEKRDAALTSLLAAKERMREDVLSCAIPPIDLPDVDEDSYRLGARNMKLSMLNALTPAKPKEDDNGL